MKLPSLDEGQKDLVIVMCCLFGGGALLMIAVGIVGLLFSLGGGECQTS